MQQDNDPHYTTQQRTSLLEKTQKVEPIEHAKHKTNETLIKPEVLFSKLLNISSVNIRE